LTLHCSSVSNGSRFFFRRRCVAWFVSFEIIILSDNNL